MKYNIRLSIKAIIRAEQILSKPFTEIDYSNIDELVKLLYCLVLVNNNVVFTLEEFQTIVENEKQFSAMMKEIEKANVVLAQFSHPTENNTQGPAVGPQYLKDLAGMLIMSGMDAGYVMNDMEISDIPVFVESYERRKREDMEAQRLWTFLSVAPHIDTKKLRTAEDFFAFPWEQAERKRKAEVVMKKNTDEFYRFLDGEYNHFLSN